MFDAYIVLEIFKYLGAIITCVIISVGFGSFVFTILYDKWRK